jgi:flagellar biosynthesis chaperone FliJ
MHAFQRIFTERKLLTYDDALHSHIHHPVISKWSRHLMSKMESFRSIVTYIIYNMNNTINATNMDMKKKRNYFTNMDMKRKRNYFFLYSIKSKLLHQPFLHYL